MTSEHAALIQLHNTADKNHSSTASDLRTQSCCRVYREFAKFHSLYNCIPFMNVKNYAEVKAQIHTLYRVRELCKSNVFRTVKHAEVTEQNKNCLSAQHEERKFLSCMHENK